MELQASIRWNQMELVIIFSVKQLNNGNFIWFNLIYINTLSFTFKTYGQLHCKQSLNLDIFKLTIVLNIIPCQYIKDALLFFSICSVSSECTIRISACILLMDIQVALSNQWRMLLVNNLVLVSLRTCVRISTDICSK